MSGVKNSSTLNTNIRMIDGGVHEGVYEINGWINDE